MNIIELEPFWITGYEIQATQKQLKNHMNKVWSMLFENAGQIQDRSSNTFMEISFGKNQYGIYTKFIGVKVSGTNGVIPAGMQRIRIARNKYLHYEHESSQEDTARTFDKMFQWAEANKLYLGELTLNTGYTPNDEPESHNLYIVIED